MAISKTIGSAEKTDITLSSRYISDLHAILTENEGRFFIEDQNSTFGTFVNGKRIDRATELLSRDKVRLGTLLFHWQDYTGSSDVTESHSIYFKDLFSPFGKVRWADYKIILLLALGATFLLPLAIPAFLSILTAYLRIQYKFLPQFGLLQYSEIIILCLSIPSLYIFLNLTRKAIFGKGVGDNETRRDK